MGHEKPISGQLIELLPRWRCMLGAPAGSQAVVEPDGQALGQDSGEW